jgi:hypothetical protein
MALDEECDRVVPEASAVLLHVPLARADLGEEPLHLRRVGEDLSVEVARVPPQQDPADIEDDRGGAAWSRSPHPRC